MIPTFTSTNDAQEFAREHPELLEDLYAERQSLLMQIDALRAAGANILALELGFRAQFVREAIEMIKENAIA